MAQGQADRESPVDLRSVSVPQRRQTASAGKNGHFAWGEGPRDRPRKLPGPISVSSTPRSPRPLQGFRTRVQSPGLRWPPQESSTRHGLCEEMDFFSGQSDPGSTPGRRKTRHGRKAQVGDGQWDWTDCDSTVKKAQERFSRLLSLCPTSDSCVQTAQTVKERIEVRLCMDPIDSERLYSSRSFRDFPGAFTISTGAQHLCGLEQASGRVFCWGSGDYGQLGDNLARSSEIPVRVQNLAPALAVTAGGLHSCAVEEDGGAKCWGKGEDGQLGFGGRSRRWEARPVARLGPAVDIRAGGSHTCALEMSGIVRCWGWGEFGQLGDGRALDSLYPVRVAQIERADAICSGALHSCAVESGLVTLGLL
eukprot:s191_g10.t1